MILLRRLAMLLVLCVPILAAEKPKENSRLPAPGIRAPAFALRDLRGRWTFLRSFCGEKLKNPWRNKKRYAVILSFWATYCVPCRKEIPELQKLAARYSDNVKLFLISIDTEGKTVVKPHIDETGWTAPVLLDRYQKIAQKYGVRSVPALFLVDPMGTIRLSESGYKGEESLGRLAARLEQVYGKSDGPGVDKTAESLPDADKRPELHKNNSSAASTAAPDTAGQSGNPAARSASSPAEQRPGTE